MVKTKNENLIIPYFVIHKSPSTLILSFMSNQVIVHMFLFVLLIILKFIWRNIGQEWLHIMLEYNALLLFVMVFFQSIIAGYSFFQWYKERYCIFPDFIKYCKGVFTKQGYQHTLYCVQNINFTQGWFGKFFNYGDIYIEVLLRGQKEVIKLMDIQDPEIVMEIVKNNIRMHRPNTLYDLSHK